MRMLGFCVSDLSSQPCAEILTTNSHGSASQHGGGALSYRMLFQEMAAQAQSDKSVSPCASPTAHNLPLTSTLTRRLNVDLFPQDRQYKLLY